MRNREERKRSKGQETTIGKIIYGFLLFLPLLAIGVTCGYAMFNKNAYQSYASDETTSLQEINSYQSLYVNETYTINSVIKPLSGSYQTPIFSFDEVDNFCKSLGMNQNLTYVAINFTLNATNNCFANGYTKLDTTTHASENHETTVNFINIKLPITFKLTHIYAPSGYQSLNNMTIYRNFTHKLELSEIFYHSIDKLQESSLFNWAENSIIYTTTHTTCNTLSITTPFIPLLMSYWLIISVIYFLYDIALMLVWIIHKKVHELQESI